jgi:hypothetical protein
MSNFTAAFSTVTNPRQILRSVLFGLLYSVLTCSCLSAQTNSARDTATGPGNSCEVSEPTIDGATEVDGLEAYKVTIVGLLKQQEFDALDCIATAARSGKVRLPGGLWKLHNIYVGLSEPTGHATDEDWKDRITLLQSWVTARPNSMTARVALAKAYNGYAWFARGNGYADSVTNSGWKLYEERIEKAKATLDEAAALPGKRCPEWYLLMQGIADGSDETAVYEEAVAFEPTYYYYYRAHAMMLLPKWNGKEGEASAFAAQVADRVGGTDGDMLYFQIASYLACPCNEPEFPKLSWDRIQKGFAALEKTYGSSAISSNLFARMAVQSRDYIAADPVFKQIGDQWDKEVWQTHEYFEANRNDAAKIGPLQARSRAALQEADANQQTPEGTRYQKQVAQKFGLLVHECSAVDGADLQKFDYLLLVNKKGTPQNGWSPQPTNMVGCLGKQLLTAQIKKKALFPAPPRDGYWVKIEVDPSPYKAAAN